MVRRMTDLKKIAKVLFPLLLFIFAMYTALTSRVDVGGVARSQSLSPNDLVFFQRGEPYAVCGPSASRTKIGLQGAVSTAARWVGYSSSSRGTLFIDATNRIGVLRVDVGRRQAQVATNVDTREFKGEWGLHDDILYSVSKSANAVFLESRRLGDKGSSTKMELPIAAVPGYISRPSICGSRLAVSIASSIYLVDMRRNKAKQIGLGVNPVFLKDNVVVYALPLCDQNRVMLEAYLCKSRKRVRYDVWRARGIGRFPVLLPMVPHIRPYEIKRVAPIDGKCRLLVEVRRLGYGDSDLFLVNTSTNSTVRLPYVVDRPIWELVPLRQLQQECL